MNLATMADLTKSINSTRLLDAAMKALDGRNSKTARKLLNLVLPQVIPFNRPLGLKVTDWTESRCEVELPFRRATKNHLGGLHACALATVGEYAAGMLVLRAMDPARQRLVLRNLNVEFLKQGRGTAVASAEWPAELAELSRTFKTSEDEHELRMTTIVRSREGVELARVHTEWQMKPWSKVRKK